MKKQKKINLSLNKKVISNLEISKVEGGGEQTIFVDGCGLATNVICGTMGGCTSYEIFPKKCHFA
ncbi:hypothetical protein GTQ40_08620 [Flavobacteriaceae bacterium R38]|nr:hypothetical protein [Flavobacteriaceae bacterium R38]